MEAVKNYSDVYMFAYANKMGQVLVLNQLRVTHVTVQKELEFFVLYHLV